MRRCDYLPLPARLALIAALTPVAFVIGPVVDAVQQWRNREEQTDGD